MHRRTRTVLHVVIVALAVGFAAQTVKAQDKDPLDPVTVDPEHYKVLYEDANVRVLRYDDAPGHVVPLHHHKYPYKVYVVTNATREFLPTDAAGKTCEATATPTKLFANDELMRLPVKHCEANNGTTPTHLVIFEFKDQTITPTVAARRRPTRSSNRTRR
jgi:hypothetical protein